MYILAILAGIICAGIGGEIFVRGSVQISKWLRVPVKVIGVTVAAFATSSPEFAVAVTASLAGANAISLGDALGSNVVNILLILGLALIIKPMKANLKEVSTDFTYAALAPLFMLLIAADGVINRTDALMMFMIFGLWIGWTLKEVLANKSKDNQKVKENITIWKPLLLLGTGLIFLILSGKFIVYGATNIALAMGISPFIIGATIVAISTGTPEFATTLIARIKGHDDLSLGTILGSNIFNALFIVSVAAMISPIQIELKTILLPIVFGFLSILMLMPRNNAMSSSKGWVLVVTYFVYILLTINTPIK